MARPERLATCGGLEAAPEIVDAADAGAPRKDGLEPRRVARRDVCGQGVLRLFQGEGDARGPFRGRHAAVVAGVSQSDRRAEPGEGFGGALVPEGVLGGEGE